MNSIKIQPYHEGNGFLSYDVSVDDKIWTVLSAFQALALVTRKIETLEEDE